MEIYIYTINGYLNNLIYKFYIDTLRLSYAISREGIFPEMAHALACLISALLVNPDSQTPVTSWLYGPVPEARQDWSEPHNRPDLLLIVTILTIK